MLVDTHCHLDLPPLVDELPEVLRRAREAGVGHVVVPGVAPAGWEAIRSLGENGGVSSAFGLHPMHAELWSPCLQERLIRLLPAAAAMGEIGLDYTLPVPRELQQGAFRDQLRLARRAGLPVLIHCRSSFADTIRILREERISRGVMHSFSGSVETAQECLRLGLFISISGVITREQARRLPEVVRRLPLERLLLETDAPDLTPEPHRGRPNEPAFLPLVAQRVAEIRSVPAEEVGGITTANARKLFCF